MRTRSLLAAMIVIPALSGCSFLFGPSDPVQDRLDAMGDAFNSCGEKRGGGSHLDFAICVNGAFTQAMYEVNYPFTDIITGLTVERRSLAQMLDRGELSEAEALTRLEQKIAEASQTDRSRGEQNKRRTVQAASSSRYFLKLMQAGV